VSRRHWPTISIVGVVFFLIATCAPATNLAHAQLVVRYRPPVDAPIVEHFHLPPKPWMAGNRGIDYATEPGSSIHAAAAGEVIFAGEVGGWLHVTVRHEDGLRTTYSFVQSISVKKGMRVTAETEVALAGEKFHFGIRTPDDMYLDPEKFLRGEIKQQFVLTPSSADGADPLEERRSFLQLVAEKVGELSQAAVSTATSELRFALHYAAALSLNRIAIVVARDSLLALRQKCTATTTATPKISSRRIAVLVSGLGTGSGDNSAWHFPTQEIGYDDADVVRFSYRGGHVRSQGERISLQSIQQTEFSAIDSQQDIELSADRLNELLKEISVREPGVPIDVLAHSQGGVVARLAVSENESSHVVPTEVENLVTVASPHQGAPLATAVDALQKTPSGPTLLEEIRNSGAFDELDDRRSAITQLSEVSAITNRAAAANVVPRFTAIGGSGDLVVPGTSALSPAADYHYLVPTDFSTAAHGDLVSHPTVAREISRVVNGQAPTCRSVFAVARDTAAAEGIRFGESAVGLAGHTLGRTLTF